MDPYRIRSEFNQAYSSFPNIELYQNYDGSLHVKAILQTSVGKQYIASIFFTNLYPNEMPNVYITAPKISSAPHMYKSGSICYLYPTMWNPGRHNLEFVIVRTAKWLNKYEVWKNTYRWPGASIPH